MCEACTEFSELLNSIPEKEKLTKQDGDHPLLRKAEIEKVFSFMQSWFQRQCICCFRDPKNYDKFHWITQNIVLLVVKQLKAYKGEDIIRTSIAKRIDEDDSSGDEKKNKRFNKNPGKVKIVELEESPECSEMEKDETPKTSSPEEKSDAKSDVDTGGGEKAESGSAEKKDGDKKPDEGDKKVGEGVEEEEEENEEEKKDSELWTIAEMEKLLHFLSKVFQLNFPLYAAYKQAVQNKMEELTQQEAAALNVFCDLHDLEIPIHLLRNVSLFCRSGGVQAMTSCFEHHSLPVAVAHAMIAVVCNLKLWLNFRTIMELFIPLRSRVLRYMCNMADKELRTQGIKSMADFMWTAVKDPMDSPITFDRDGLNLSFKYFISSTLTMRLAGIAQINHHINIFNDMCNSENIIEVESVGQNLASWLIDNNIISHIFGPNLHVEVIKQSHVILNFLAMECKITNEHIDIIWQAAQLKHCSKQVQDLLPPLIKNLEPGPVLHLYHLLCKLEPKDHTEQSLVLASALIKIVWNSSSSCNDGPGFLSLSKAPVAAAHRRSRRLSHVHMSSSDNTNSDGDSSQGSDGHKSESEASECPKRKKRKIEKAVVPEDDTSDESIKIEEVINPLGDGETRKGSPKQASKVRRRMKASQDPRQCQKHKMHVKQARRKAKIDKVDMESSEEEAIRSNNTKLEHKNPPSNRNRKNVSAEKLKASERTKKESVKMEECSDDNEEEDDEDDDEDDDESDSEEEAGTPAKAGVSQEVPNIVLRQGNTEFIQLVGDQSSPDSGQGAVMTELASLVQGSHNSNSYIRTFQASHEMMDEMLSPEEGSLSSRMSNKSEKNMADFDGEDSWNEWRQLEIDAKAHMAQETLADIEIHSRFNKISTMVGGLQELAPILSQFNLENVCKPGNTLLWDLIQDDKIGLLGEGLALEAEKALCNLLCYNSDKLIRMKFIEGCLDNVAKNWSVVVSLRMLPKLFTSFQQLRGGNMETNHVTLWAMQEHSMMDRFFENLRVVTSKGPIPLTHVQVRLQFLTHIYSPLGLPDNIRLSVEELDALWSCLTADRLSCDELFGWLLRQAKAKDAHALHVDTLGHLYTRKLPSLEPETISMTALSLYQQLCNMARLASAHLDHAPIDHLWRIALRANNTDVSMAAIQYLNSYYMGRQLEQESEFVSQCMGHLADATHDLATNEEASLLCIQRALLLLKTHLETFKKRYAYHLRKWALEGQCVGSHVIGERGGTPLKVIIQPAGMVDKVTLDMLSTDYVADLRAEVAKWWEMLTAKQAAMPTQNNSNMLAADGPIRMITQGQELTTEFDEKTLQEIGFKDLQMVFISMGASRQKKRGDSSLDTPSVLPPPPREFLPTLLLLLPKNFEQLFRLMDTLSTMKTQVKGGHQIPHTKAQVLSRRVWDILTLLPTNSTLLQGFRHLDSESKLKELLDPASPQKLMYSLHIVESLSRNPSPSSIPRSSGEPLDVTDSINWSQKFVQHGGLKYLFNIFMSGVLQVSIGGSEWHQDCLACLLKLLCQLGFQPSENDAAESLRANRRKRAHKLEKITVQKLSQAMLQEMKIDTVIPRLTSILYEASLPRDPNHYKTGFWGRAQVVQYAMSVVVSWAHTVNGVREALCAEERFVTWLRRLILEEPEPSVRREVCSALYKLCTPQHAPAMLAHLLQFLDNAEKMRPQSQEVLHQPFEDGKEPYGPACRDYFWLLCRLVDSLSDELVRDSIEDPSACVIDVEGLASRVHESIVAREYLERRHNTVDDDGLIGLLNLMCNLLKHNPPFKTEKQGELLLDQVFEFLFALPDPANRHFPKCKSQTARSAAYDLLVELVKGCVHNYKHLHEKLLAQHNPGPHSPYPWEYWPHDDGRAACGYVGLTNLGATCYMASCMQHLYMMPQARLEILRAQCDPTSKHQLTLHELQRMFAYLLESERKAYNPRSFCKVYTMDHQPLNTGEQKDMAEFFIDLVSKLEEMTPELKKLVKTLFGGVISNNVLSLDCDHVSRTLEEFYTVRCQVADMRNLYESLDEVTVKDTLEGDNMYTCSQCGKKVRAEKRACFKKLPQILCFNTMRYTFNMVTMLKEKVNTHFSFPMRLDMSGYVEKHLMPQHYQEEKRQSEKDGKEPEETYEYDLIGVTVHTGTADGGHYYSFIRDRDRAKDKWFLFNDAEVKPFDPNQIAAECFGGEMTSKTYDSVTDKFMDLSFEKTNSAYMLFYEWTRGDAGEGGSKEEGEGVSGGPGVQHTQEAPHITLSTELEGWIWQDNMHFLQDKNIFEHTYFQFMWQICGYIPQTLTNCEEVTQMAAQLTTTFFMETFIHAKEKPTMVQWMELLTKQFVVSGVACEWFLQHMAHNSWWPVQILIKCPNQIVRQMFQRLALHVINQLRAKHAPLLLKMDSDDEGGGLEDCDPDKIGYQSCVTMFVRMLLSLMEHGAKPHLKHLTEYFALLYDFSKLGDEESQFMISVRAISTMVNFYLGQKLHDYVEVFSEEEEEDDVIPMPADKYKPASLEKMITLVAMLVEKSRGPDHNLRLSNVDYSAIAGGKGFPFLFQQIKDYINLHQTRNLIYSLCRWNDRLATHIVAMIFTAIQKHADICQPFFKLLTLLTEMSGGPNGLPCFTQLVLSRVWDVAEVCPHSALEWLAIQVARNKIAHQWVMQNLDTWVEHYLLAHVNQRVRSSAAYLLVSLVPSPQFRQCYRAARQHKELILSPESQEILHTVYTVLLRLLKKARHYTDINTHSSSKLTTYFTLLNFFAVSKKEKLMFGQYLLDLWQLFHPKLSEPGIAVHLNKQALLLFWYHVSTDCPENVQLILQNAHIVKNIAFNYILADHEDQDVVAFNRTMLPAYYGLLRLCCQQSRAFTRQLATHQNINWAFKNITPFPTQYSAAVDELFKLMQIFVAKYPDTTENEIIEINNFRKQTINLYLQVLDGRSCWATLISAFRILVETDEDRLYVMYSGGLQMCFESFHTLHVMYHEATACHVTGDVLDMLSILLDLAKCLKFHRDTKDVRSLLLSCKDWMEVLRKLVTLLNTYNPPEMRNQCIDVLKELVFLLPTEVLHVLVPLLSHCHSAFQESANAVPMGPYFPRRGHKLPPPGLKAAAAAATRPIRPMVQMAVPHNLVDAAKGTDPDYDEALSSFYTPYHNFIDVMCRLAINHDCMNDALVNLSAIVGFEGVPLHLTFFPKLWLDIYHAQNVDRKYITMLTNSNYFVDYVEAILLDERPSLNIDIIYDFLVTYFPKVAEQVLTDQTCLLMESIVTTLAENMASGLNVCEHAQASRLNGDLRALAIVYSVELPVIPHPQLEPVLNQLLTQINNESGECPWKKRKLATEKEEEKPAEKPAEESKAASTSSPKAETSSSSSSSSSSSGGTATSTAGCSKEVKEARTSSSPDKTASPSTDWLETLDTTVTALLAAITQKNNNQEDA
ncbi:ubiquitin carboxyl-terminal hydrolase 34 isoform X3 [Nilaparvata lugens]|uniref:ubiquitin carboxyl-terminal hydrolase 34 isoform X3 n=1 Tax=Nilaparvata lugens TaxID=108931 RepID=UPI00193E7585|nr:ubiquitin carboxyl-terminal hydrolase 34 isoform X3 [Nilaparvata lugens]